MEKEDLNLNVLCGMGWWGELLALRRAACCWQSVSGEWGLYVRAVQRDTGRSRKRLCWLANCAFELAVQQMLRQGHAECAGREMVEGSTETVTLRVGGRRDRQAGAGRGVRWGNARLRRKGAASVSISECGQKLGIGDESRWEGVVYGRMSAWRR